MHDRTKIAHVCDAEAVREAYVRLFGVEPNPPSVDAMLPAGFDAKETAIRVHNIHLLVNWTLDEALADGSLAASAAAKRKSSQDEADKPAVDS